MKASKLDDNLQSMISLARRLATSRSADALLIFVEAPLDWEELQSASGDLRLLIAADDAAAIQGASEAELHAILLDSADTPVVEKLTHALLASVGRELLVPGASVVALYSGFEEGQLDSISFIHLEEHLGRLTARDLQRIVTHVPLETVKTVVDLAIEIGREGREGKPVGTLFVVGDTRRVQQYIHPAGFDPVKGYSRKERTLRDSRVREAVKEIAPLDGAFIVSPDGVVEKACQLIDAAHADLTLSKGLGSRHWAAAAISKVTSAIAVVVSQSNGTVRIFQHGEVILRIEPYRRAMKWKASDYDPPATAEG